jgi:hypothetical protein
MKPKSLGFHRTEGANNHIEQGNALIFARHPIGVTYNQLVAMLTNVFHIFFLGARNMPYWIDLIVQQIRTFNGFQKDFLSNNEEINFLIGSMGGGNCCRFINLCERMAYRTLSLLSRCFLLNFTGRYGVLV